MKFDLKAMVRVAAAGNAAYSAVQQNITPLQEVINAGLVRLPYAGITVNKPNPKPEGGSVFAAGYYADGQVLDLGKIILSDETEELVIDNALVALSIQKNIIETAIAGRDFSVVEIVSAENWQISITAYIINQSGLFPENELIKLRKFFFKNRALKVVNDYLRMMDIAHIVIKDLTLPDAGGYVNVIPYQITAVNDALIDLELRS